MPTATDATGMMVRCGKCQQEYHPDGDAADILAARLAAGGVIPCQADGCTGHCLPVARQETMVPA